MKSLAEENYLKALYHLSNDQEGVSVNDLSKELDIKMPTVTGMMKKFAQKKWVYYQSYKPIKLTEKGRKEAALIVRKHRLTEMFLVQVMGIGWDEVHDIAEQMEHVKSPFFFDKMDEMLNYPKFDPHGSPIPDKLGNEPTTNYLPLSECEPNETVLFCAVNQSSDEFLKFLNTRNLSLDTQIKILEREEFDDSLRIAYEEYETILSEKACKKILVQKVKSAAG